MIGLLAHVAGLDDPTGAWYLFWSGIGSDLSRIVAALLVIGPFAWLYKHHQCAADGCKKLALHAHHCHLHR